VGAWITPHIKADSCDRMVDSERETLERSMFSGVDGRKLARERSWAAGEAARDGTKLAQRAKLQKGELHRIGGFGDVHGMLGYRSGIRASVRVILSVLGGSLPALPVRSDIC
jgi:hypothetical protein